MCGGVCCKTLPGAVFPNDIGDITVDRIVELLNSGFQFDYWEGNPTDDEKYDDVTAFYLRPQTKNSTNKIVDASWGGECIFLTETGCSKLFNDRPTQCRTLVPNKEYQTKGCHQPIKYSKRSAAAAWLPYNGIIITAIGVMETRTLLYTE